MTSCRSQSPSDLDAVQTRQHDVEHDGIDGARLSDVGTFEAILRQGHRVVGFLETLTQQLAHRCLVLDHQDPQGTPPPAPPRFTPGDRDSRVAMVSAKPRDRHDGTWLFRPVMPARHDRRVHW